MGLKVLPFVWQNGKMSNRQHCKNSTTQHTTTSATATTTTAYQGKSAR